MLRLLLISVFPLLILPALGQEAGDFRSKGSGNWNSASIWERFDGISWLDAEHGQIPGQSASVWIQNGHIITLTANHSVKNLHINVGISATDGSGHGRLNIGNHTLDLHGFIRTYRAAIGITPGINWSEFIGPSSLSINSTASGKLRVVGASRALTAPGSYSDGMYRYRLSIEVDPTSMISLNSRFRASEIDIVSGTLDAGVNSIRIQSDAAFDPIERLIVRSGAKLISSASGTDINALVIGRGNNSHADSLIVESNGVLELRGAAPRIGVKNLRLDGKVVYGIEGDQTLLRAGSAGSAGIGSKPEKYGTIELLGNGLKTIPTDYLISVSDSLILGGSATLATTGTGDLSFDAASDNVWVVYRGSVPQRPGNLDWPNNISKLNFLLDNPAGLTINDSKVVGNRFVFGKGKVNVEDGGSITLVSNGLFLGAAENAFVNGPIQVRGDGEHFLPLGKNSVYRPVYSQIKGESHTYSVELFDFGVSGIPVEPIRKLKTGYHWEVKRIEGTLEPGSMTFLYEPDDLPSSPEDIKIAFSPNRDGVFSPLPIIEKPDIGLLRVSVNPSGFYTPGTTLPMSVLSFLWVKANVKNNHGSVLLEWAMTTDEESHKVVVERSRDGLTWRSVSEIPILQGLRERVDFSHVDRPYSAGRWYYRLVKHYHSGERIYSDILRIDLSNLLTEISVSLDEKRRELVINPTQNTIKRISIYSLEGQLVLSTSNELRGDVQTRISLPFTMKPALYILVLEGTGKVEKKKIYLNPSN
jgi:hypothetical protein